MRTLLFVSALLALISTEASYVNVENCKRSAQAEDYVRSSNFSWGMQLDEIKAKEAELYERGLRLKERAYYEDGKVYFPFTPPGNQEQKVFLSERFIKSIIGHVENGLKRKYVDAIIFPDMGHSHLFVNQEFYNNVVKDIPVREGHKRYELMLNHPETRFLYHTAEQLQMKTEEGQFVEDRHVQWRFFTRNLVGHNKNQGKIELLHNETHSHNTARDYDEGFRYWGAGFNISATKNGCFAYSHKGQTYYFDLSLKDLEP